MQVGVEPAIMWLWIGAEQQTKVEQIYELPGSEKMWSVQRLCKLEVVLFSSMTFFFGVTITYFTVYYAGYGVDKCRESPTLYYKDGELRWPRKVDKDGFPTPDPDRDKKRKDQGQYGRPASYSMVPWRGTG